MNQQRGFALILVIIMVLAVFAVGGGVVYYIAKQKTPAMQPSITSQLMPQLSPQSTTTPTLQQTVRDQTEEDRLWEADLMKRITLSPAPGIIVHPGDMIKVQLTFPKDFQRSYLKDDSVFFLTQGEGGQELHLTQWPGPFSFLWKVPDRLGRLEIMADWTYDWKKTYVVSQPKSPLGYMLVDPSDISFDYLGIPRSLRVTGKYVSGETYDITSSDTGTLYSTQSGSDAVIAVSKAGEVKPKGNGKDWVVISNSGVGTAIPVVVNITNYAPQFLGIATTTIKAGGTKTVDVTAFRDPDGNNLNTSFATVNTANCSQPGEHSSFPRCLWNRSTYRYEGSVNVIDHGGGKISIELKPTPEDFGEFDVIIQAVDDGNPELGNTARFRVIVIK